MAPANVREALERLRHQIRRLQPSRRHHKVKPLASRATTTGVDIRDPLKMQEDLLRSNIAVAQDLVNKHHHKCV